ncbi:MAG: NAD-dependent dehydratase [Bacteroidetes bacterium]|nr:NAD-dependent dehydratase [Bacteroidota bacterium]
MPFEIKNTRVLVTGADGFIGSHLAETLALMGCKVRALSLYNSFNNWGWLENSTELEKMEVVTGDVRDPFFCKVITKDIDVVFHLAALIAIPYSYVAPASYVDTNITGTLNMVQASFENGVKKFIHTSTSEVYGTALYAPIDEKHPLQPQSPYSASKIGADAIAMSYYNAFNFPVVIARPFNTYGPRQSARAVIPNIISQIAAGRKELSLGELSPLRDFNFVKDTCNGFIELAKCDATVGMSVNIGSGSEISIGDLAELIKKLMQSNIVISEQEERKRPAKSEVFRLLSDITIISQMTSYRPKYSLEEGLKQTINWFQNSDNLKRYKTNLYNV